MLSRNDNELLTRVGPGTPMGNLMREYWTPLMHSVDLPERDGPPVRVRILCENLIAFRDSSGNVGLMANACPHRGASMFFGRNEEDGLRCVYHGWKFDVSGQCTDMPNEPAESNFRHKIRLQSYPCREVNGIIWTYMGSRPTPPPFPEHGFGMVDEAHRGQLKYVRECNWMQALEGDIDTAHLGFLHVSFSPRQPGPTRTGPIPDFTSDKAPTLHVVNTDIGVMYGARRNRAEGDYYWRVSQFLMPIYTSIPGFGGRQSCKIWVPIDDENTLVWEPNWSMRAPLTPDQLKGWINRVPPSGFLPDTTDWNGRFRFVAREANDFHLDRERQRTVNFTGFEESNPIQDGGIQVTMGHIFDRTKEHMGTTDATIIQVRKRLLEAAKALRDEGITPPGVDMPELYHLHGCEMNLPEGANWTEACKDMIAEMA